MTEELKYFGDDQSRTNRSRWRKRLFPHLRENGNLQKIQPIKKSNTSSRGKQFWPGRAPSRQRGIGGKGRNMNGTSFAHILFATGVPGKPRRACPVLTGWAWSFIDFPNRCMGLSVDWVTVGFKSLFQSPLIGEI